MRWTPEEDAIVHRMYARYPHTAIAASIQRHTGRTRTLIAIRNRAAIIGIANREIPKGYTRLVDAHDKNTRNHKAASNTIIRAATKAGVIKRAEYTHGRPHIAPTAWVDTWLEEHYRAELPAQEAVADDVLDWVRTREVARRIGIEPARAAYKLIHQRGWLSKAARGMRRVRVNHQPGRPLYWHPEDVDELVRQVRERLRSPKTHWKPIRGLGHPALNPKAIAGLPAAPQTASQ